MFSSGSHESCGFLHNLSGHYAYPRVCHFVNTSSLCPCLFVASKPSSVRHWLEGQWKLLSAVSCIEQKHCTVVLHNWRCLAFWLDWDFGLKLSILAQVPSKKLRRHLVLNYIPFLRNKTLTWISGLLCLKHPFELQPHPYSFTELNQKPFPFLITGFQLCKFTEWKRAVGDGGWQQALSPTWSYVWGRCCAFLPAVIHQKETGYCNPFLVD